MRETIIGIDLGTTNSEVAVMEGGQPTIIPLSNGDKMLPSVVGIDHNNNNILVGVPAHNQYILDPENTIKSIKRKMGQSEKVSMAGQEYSPQEISGAILKELKKAAEAHLGHQVNKAVVTVPAYFNDAQRQATREAGEIAGMEVVRMINEPTAAALSYEAGHHGSRKILIYDLGGGTFDVSVVQIEDGVVEVISSHGNNRLGGDDFDQKIIDHLLEFMETKHGVQTHDAKTMARIVRAAENAKKTLSDQPFVNIEEEYLLEKNGQPVHLSTELTRDQYEEMIFPYIEETLQAIHTALHGADMTASDVEQILLVGGATRTPLVSRRLEEMFGLKPRGEVNPDLCVALGAAIQGSAIGGDEVHAVLVDVTPYTFGTSYFGKLDGMLSPHPYAPVIAKNTPIPVQKGELFYTVMDGQSAVDVKVFQGEDPDSRKNIQIGEFMVEGLDDVPAGNPILFQFDLDINGILHVSAKEKNTGLEKRITIDNAFRPMEKQNLVQARERLDALFGEEAESDDDDDHDSSIQGRAQDEDKDDKDDKDEKIKRKEVVQAKALIEKAERMMDDAEGEDREEISNLVETMQDALNNQDGSALKNASEELADILYYLET